MAEARRQPAASPVEARLETLRAFKVRGCGVGAAAMPLLPFLTDGDAQLDWKAGLGGVSTSESKRDDDF